MSLLIQEFRTLHRDKEDMRMTRMADFLATFAELDRQQRACQVDFNLFSLFRIETDEVRHSRFLAWLFDARAGHGQGTTFLHAFAEACQLDIPSDALDRCRVRTEYSGGEAIIDILVYRLGAFVIYLENKVLAPEGMNQVDRELRDMHHLGESLQVPEARRFAIFLTPDGRAPCSGNAACWRCISYGQLARAFEQRLPEIENTKVRAVVQDWIGTVTIWGGSYELDV